MLQKMKAGLMIPFTCKHKAVLQLIYENNQFTHFMEQPGTMETGG